jgi:dethiobiotin synthetase
MKQFVIVGIGTDVGKTVVSAIFTKALNAYYWKPVQAGDLYFTDTDKVSSFVGETFKSFPERWRLNTPASPHFAAEIDQVTIKKEDFKIPDETPLIIEGAGGLMVPLNSEGLLYLDLIEDWKLPVILVSRHYLGSINHTLMSIESLKSRKIQIEMVVFNGDENNATESIIKTKHPDLKYVSIKQLNEVNAKTILDASENLKNQLEIHAQ